MPPADTSRVGYLALCMEFQRLFGVEDSMVACSGTVVVAQICPVAPLRLTPGGVPAKRIASLTRRARTFLENGVFAVNIAWRPMFRTEQRATGAPGSPP
jgi:hypothetical protein